MMTPDLRNTIKYIEENSFKGMTYDDPRGIVINGRQFAIARLTDYGLCSSYDALIKFIEDNGGTVKDRAIKSADYLIVTPSACNSSSIVYKEEKDKYEKALGYRKTSARPRIIRDIDFYIVNDMFSKLKMDDKRRVVLEYNRNSSLFSEKTAKKVENFIISKAKDDDYLKTKNLKAFSAASSKAALLIPDEQERSGFTLHDWRKYFSLSKGLRAGKEGYILNKCKALNESIRIPAKIEGVPVVAVNRNAFSNLGDHVKEVILPYSVVFVENNAFVGCDALQTVVVENPKCMIMPQAFMNCPALKK